MKKGITSTIAFELEIEVTDVAEVIFTFKEKIDSENYLLQKSYPEDVTFEDNKFLCKLIQEETDSLTNTFFVEAQVNLTNKSVIKSDIGKEIMPPTLWTTFVEDNESSGEEEIITLTFTDYVEGGGSGGTTNYNELSNKPRFNDIEWVGNKTDSDMGLATKQELVGKADKTDTYTKSETNNLLSGKQDTVSGGNGIDITNNVVSVDVHEETLNYINFINKKLYLDIGHLGQSGYLRYMLANTSYNNPLASKSYVDNLLSGATKWEFVSQLPTENIDIHTIYFVPKESAETDNIYNEWVYALQSRNPDVYDWELLGTNEVDLSNYYTKTESDNKYQLIIDSSHKLPSSLVSGIYTDTQIDNIVSGLIDIQTFNQEEQLTLTLLNEIKSNEIATSDYSMLVINSVDLPSGSTLKMYPTDIYGNELPPIDVRANRGYPVFQYSSVEFYYSGSENEVDLTFTLDNLVVRSREFLAEILNLQESKQDIINAQNKLDADYIQDGSTNKPSNWNAKSKIFDAVMVSGNISQDATNYPNIQYGDIAIDKISKRMWRQAQTPTSDTVYWSEIEYSKAKTTKSENNPSTSGNGNIGDLWVKGNQVWVLTNRAGNTPPYTLTWTEVTQDLSAYQPLIDTTHKLSADNVDDTSTTNKFVTSTEKSTWNGKEDKTTISTDTSSTTVSLTLADNHEYRYTQDLTSLTLTMPSGDFIASVVFASGSTPTSMTYDSSIKWSGDDVTNGQFVPTEKTYNIVMWYDGINVNGVVRGV